MRAINLVPADARSGRVSGGKSGGAVYGVLGVLLVAILAASVLALSKRDQARSQAELATVEQSTQAYTRVASQYASFEEAAKQANDRINTVRGLAAARFDWAGALRDLSRLIPQSANIGALSASVDTTSGQAAGGASSQLRSAIGTPAIAMTGCTLNQDTAANLVAQLQAMRRVTNVTLESSKLSSDAKKVDFETPGCGGYEFQIVVFFAPGNAKAAVNASAEGSGATTISTEPSGATSDTTASTTPAGN